MIIQKPISYKPDPKNHRTTRLFFKGQKSANFYMAGAIAWPDGKYPGFVILSGQNMDDELKRIWIFDEQEFWTIDNWTREDGNLKENMDKVSGTILGYWYGLSHFISTAWAKYGCRNYFFGGQHPDTNERNLRGFYKSNIIPKSINLIEVPFVKEVGDNIVSEYVKLQKFVADKNSKLFQMMNTPPENENGGKQAIKCLFAGYEHVPWVDIKFKVKQKVRYMR